MEGASQGKDLRTSRSDAFASGRESIDKCSVGCSDSILNGSDRLDLSRSSGSGQAVGRSLERLVKSRFATQAYEA